MLHCYIDALHESGVPESEIGFESMLDRVRSAWLLLAMIAEFYVPACLANGPTVRLMSQVDALMIEVVVHFATVRAFGEVSIWFCKTPQSMYFLERCTHRSRLSPLVSI